MGNAHGHRKHRNNVPPLYKFGNTHPPSNQPNKNEGSSNSNTVMNFPYGHVDNTLRSLAAQAEGFGRFAIGGLHGPLYHVTSLLGYCTLSPIHCIFYFIYF